VTAGLGEATVKASGSGRLAYPPPRLVRYGPLRSLTTAGTQKNVESVPGVETNKIRP